jgi:endogenous inhibitor of DNA gyrase (YacG/DUF329 family)
MSNIHPFKSKKGAGKAACPTCGKPPIAAHRPFCSARCKQLDLGKWLGGDYRLPTEEEADPEEILAALQNSADPQADR